MALTEGSLESWLGRLAAATASPSGGAAAAVTLSMAGSLAAMVAGFSTAQMADAGALRETAERLRRRAVDLAGADDQAFRELLEQRRRVAGEGVAAGEPAAEAGEPAAEAGEPPAEAGESASALVEVVRVPLRMLELAAELAPVLVRLATEGKIALRGDAVTGLHLLEGAAGAAADLVRLNASELGQSRREEMLAALAAEERRLGEAFAAAPRQRCW
jgi:formiminotetrahydrofolate cyclodeaminase